MTSVRLTPAFRQTLRAQAHRLEPVVMIGDNGLSESVIREIARSLAAHELIKVRVAGSDREARADMLGAICKATGAIPVQHIGKILVIYWERPASAEQPPAKATTPRAPARRRRPVPP